MALIDKLTNIADAIRGKTGGTDPLTLDGMATAIASIETGGGSGGGASGIYMAKITPAEEVFDLTVKHDLGTTDILMAVCFVEKLDREATNSMQARTIAKFWMKTAIPTRITTSTQGENFQIAWPFAYNNGDYRTGSSSVPATEERNSKVVDSNHFTFGRIGSNDGQTYSPLFTYTVMIVAASAFVGV